jgi:hypothetical protein
VRLRCPASGPSPSVTCPCFNRLHQRPTNPAAVIDLTNQRALAAHPAATPAVQIAPAERFRPPPKKSLPLICQQPTVTIKPGELGKLDKALPQPRLARRLQTNPRAARRATASTSPNPNDASPTAAPPKPSSSP